MSNPLKTDCTQCGWLGLCLVGCPYAHPEKVVSINATTAPKLNVEFDEDAFEILGEFVAGEQETSEGDK